MALEKVTLSPDQVVNLEEFIHSDKNMLYKCPNHSVKTLEACEHGIKCTRCDHKIPVEKIHSDVLNQI